MVHFAANSDSEDDNEHSIDNANDDGDNVCCENCESFTGWTKLKRHEIPELSQRNVVAFATANMLVLEESFAYPFAGAAEFKDANLTCMIVDFRKENPSSVCITAWFSCDESTPDELRERVMEYGTEEEPASDRGVLTDLKTMDDIQKIRPIFIRYGNEWDVSTKRSNADWEVVAKAVQWNDMNLHLARVDCSANTDAVVCNGMNTTLPQFHLYIDDDTQVADFSIEPYYQDSTQGYDFHLSKNMFEFLQNRTAWMPKDCQELEAEGLPLWTPCETKLKDIREPIMDNHLYKLENRGEMEFLLRNYDLTIVHFTDGVNEALTNGMCPLFAALAHEQHDLVEQRIVAFARVRLLKTDVQDLVELYDNDTFSGGGEEWYAVDWCSINFGMDDFWDGTGCMVGVYHSIYPANAKWECKTENALLGFRQAARKREKRH